MVSKLSVLFLLLCCSTVLVLANKSFKDVFPCAPVAPQDNPTDVRRLRPSDIKVVMAAGDSMTAGLYVLRNFLRTLSIYLLTNILFIFILLSFLRSAMQDKEWVFSAMYEYRGHVHSIGGDKDAFTIPNYLEAIRGGKQPLGASKGKDVR